MVNSTIVLCVDKHPLEITKIYTGHVNVETTNIYVDIPQEQIDFISDLQLGNFGYAYDTLAKLILPKESSIREERTYYSLVRRKFGEVISLDTNKSKTKNALDYVKF